MDKVNVSALGTIANFGPGMLKAIKADFGISIRIRKDIRPLCGLRSSAGSAAVAFTA